MMNKRVHKYLLRFGLFVLCTLMATMMSIAPASSRSVSPQQVTAFLSAPHYGSTLFAS